MILRAIFRVWRDAASACYRFIMKVASKRSAAQPSLVERLLRAPVEVPTPEEREAALIAMTLPVVDDAEVASDLRRRAPAPRKNSRRSAA